MNEEYYKKGLTSSEVNERIEKNLVNYDDVPPTKTIPRILRDNFFTYFNFINTILGVLIIIAGITGGELFESIKNCTFMGVIIFNSIISTLQEIISKKTIDKLSVLASSKVTAIRDAEEKELMLNEIVLDDVLKLDAGDQVVCDAVIIKGNAEVNESFITGEVDAISKKEGENILSGSFIVSGEIYVRVTHIGKENYISKISAEAKYNKKVNSVIMGSFESILKVLSVVIVPVGIVLMYNQMGVTNGDFTSSIFNTVGALIGMIPDGLLLLTSSVMAVSVIRLSRVNVLVQQLYCIETLARVDVICLDKTGTITMGEMEVIDVIPSDGVTKEEMDEALSNLAYAFNNSNGTMDAIKKYYKDKGVWTVKERLEFSSSRKFSSVSFYEHGIYFMGASEFVLKSEIGKYTSEIDKYIDYRVLVVAKSMESDLDNPENVKVIGFILLQDKIREEAPDTLNNKWRQL